SIADREECPLYDGLELEPQLGLVPVGRDPHSGLWEFGHLQTGEIPRRDRGGRLVITEETGLVFVLIPGGVFWMGAVASEEESADSGGAAIDAHAEEQEGPAHPVTLAPFFLSKQEMTQGQWLRVTGRNPSLYRPGSRIGGISHSLTHPVEQVSWKECERVLGRLGLLLPTEAQWEYAARGGTGTVWWTGDEPESLAGACNLRDRFCKENGAPAAWSYDEWLDDGFVAHAPVGSYRANPFGLHDVTGNVWEWCRDWFASYERPVNEADGERRTGPTRGRVNRGGSWSTPALRARTALRFRNAPTFRGSNLGLRPARSVD
ncbi:MAG: formylglycine-generating enzyme family protein, partial [Planctomycetota bacterium]